MSRESEAAPQKVADTGRSRPVPRMSAFLQTSARPRNYQTEETTGDIPGSAAFPDRKTSQAEASPAPRNRTRKSTGGFQNAGKAATQGRRTEPSQEKSTKNRRTPHKRNFRQVCL